MLNVPDVLRKTIVNRGLELHVRWLDPILEVVLFLLAIPEKIAVVRLLYARTPVNGMLRV